MIQNYNGLSAMESNNSTIARSLCNYLPAAIYSAFQHSVIAASHLCCNWGPIGEPLGGQSGGPIGGGPSVV